MNSAAQTAAARVDERRLWQRLAAMARFGATRAGGVNRQALTAEDIAAQRQLIAWGRELGLLPSTDPAGNLFLRAAGTEPDLPPLLTGSHLDSQPTGGRFDGVYGVLAGLEALEALRESGVRPRRSIEIVAWMNEEGSRFAPGMMGSEAFAGWRTLAAILPVRDAGGTTVEAALAATRAAVGAPPRELGTPVYTYLEAHIEQGPVLEREGLPIGIVTAIQGKRTFRVTVTGTEAHAGTTPRSERRDALVTAARLVGALNELTAAPEDIMFTVGSFVVHPNAPSVVPGRVAFAIDLRHPVAATLREVGDRIEPVCRAARGACEVGVEALSDLAPVEFPASITGRLEALAQSLGLPARRMPSLAGHDARPLASVCPSGMIFVPCKDGVSHNEAESALPGDLAAGTRVLAAALVELAG